MSAYDQAILAQANIIRKLAEEGPCIIVGRGADYILRDREDVLNVFLYADQADKLAYAMDTYGDRPEEAEQRVRQVDASRESYYHYLTPRQVGGPEALSSEPEHQPHWQRGGRGPHCAIRQTKTGQAGPVNTERPPSQDFSARRPFFWKIGRKTKKDRRKN